MTTTAGAGNNLRCLIPKKAADELKSLLVGEIKTNAQAEVKIKKGSQLEFSIGGKTMTARELTGNFPNWEMVLPKNFAAFAEINAKELREALTRVGVMADDKNRRVEFEFHADKVILKTESPETGNSVEEVGCTFQKLDDAATDMEDGFRTAFNTKYLTDFFSIHAARANDGRIIWKFSGASAQTELAFEGEERLFSYILVPLKN
jgi:DNA polymerase-3 subunit beta